DVDRIGHELARHLVRRDARDRAGRDEHDGERTADDSENRLPRTRARQSAVARDDSRSWCAGALRTVALELLFGHGHLLSGFGGENASARRAWDSNPRDISAHRFSRPAP